MRAARTMPAAAGMPKPMPQPHSERLAWWTEARFGLFIHWGVYAIPGRGEWVQFNEQIPVEEYARLAEEFRPAEFDAAAWAALAKDAGMKYTVLTARHHDGFALFDDPGNPFTSVSTAARRDFVAEYTKAIRQAGLHAGLYYSPLDWRFPGFFFPDLYKENAVKMREQYHRQIERLLTNYGQIDVLWFDGGETDWLSFGHDMHTAEFAKRKPGEHYRGQFSWQGEKAYETIRRLQPQIIVNNRGADVPPDYFSREWITGDFDNQTPWEACYPLAGSWGYAGDTEPMSLREAIQLLANVAGRDGNLLFNIGPRADGSIVSSHAARLREIGQWLTKYGESIYGTRGGPFLPGVYGASTHRVENIYVHILNKEISRLKLPPIPAQVSSVASLTGEAVHIRQTVAGIDLELERSGANETSVVVVLKLDRDAGQILPVPVEG
ncbi:alpha-L-fucosidase [Silvibacterium dinghuense]|nr:alpha-L-fucosidase [Silvibacterium dinghuense]